MAKTLLVNLDAFCRKASVSFYLGLSTPVVDFRKNIPNSRCKILHIVLDKLLLLFDKLLEIDTRMVIGDKIEMSFIMGEVFQAVQVCAARLELQLVLDRCDKISFVLIWYSDLVNLLRGQNLLVFSDCSYNIFSNAISTNLLCFQFYSIITINMLELCLR